MIRSYDRSNEQIRFVKIIRDYIKYVEGFVFIEMGEIKVICIVLVEEKVFFFLRNSGIGWINVEYFMLLRVI